MSVRTNLKVLALASAAILAAPMAGHADASLSLVESNLGGWTLSGTNFTSFIINSTPVGTPTSFNTSFGPGTITAVSFTGVWADSIDTSANDQNGKEFVVASNTNATVVAELDGTVSFSSNAGTISGTLYLGQAGPGDTNPFTAHNVASIMDQSGVETVPFAADGSTITIDTSAIPEPASMVMLGSGLLGLSGFLRRRRQHRPSV